MNFLRCFLSTAIAAGFILGAGCTSSPLSRIDANRPLFESWPFEIQEAILNQQVKPGMTPDMVQMSLGKPTEVINRSVQAGDDEVWVYRKSGGGSSILQN